VAARGVTTGPYPTIRVLTLGAVGRILPLVSSIFGRTQPAQGLVLARRLGSCSFAAKERFVMEKTGSLSPSVVRDGSTLVFSFGSNSTAQLRARVKAQSLAASKACLPGSAPFPLR